MDTTGQVIGVEAVYNADRAIVKLQLDNNPLNDLQALQSLESVDIRIEKHRRKRSLDANAYSWVIMQKIAEKIHSDKWSVYLEELKKYSRSFQFVLVQSEKFTTESMGDLGRTIVDHGEVTVTTPKGNKVVCHQVQIFAGSHTFDTYEMSVFIDGIVQDAKELGIDTLSPTQIAEMKERWGIDVSKSD